MADRRIVGAVLFPGFELLDIFGPLEMFGVLKQHFQLVTIAERAGNVPSAQGPSAVAERDFANCGHIDVLLLPGGIGTREQARNPAMLDFLNTIYPSLEYLASICTGSGVLAASGLLDGRRATSNKMAFAWPRSVSDRVHWIEQARWVEDGNIVTAGGVAAGIDMALALIARMHGDQVATGLANATEYEWHRDAEWDPFARLAGLI
ncbi:MAG: DJ-1/PfpI family protein [Pseudomonadales bacterium]